MINYVLLICASLLNKKNDGYHPETVSMEREQNEKKSVETVQVIVNCLESNVSKEHIERYGKIKYELPMINSYVVEVPKGHLEKVSNLQGVVKVEQDTHLTAQMNIARETINASWQEDQSNLGAGVGVAVLDTGVYPHKDFIYSGRLIGFKDYVNEHDFPYDDNGHGTHVAGIIGGDGFESNGKYRGISPKCNIIGVKVLDENGSGNISDVLAGIQWVLDNKEKYNIKVVNLSVGMVDIDGEASTLVKGVEAAWDASLYVVCAAGNNGPKPSTITTPGISRKVITVGSSDDAETVRILEDYTNDYSSRGLTKNCIKKPDIVAPGSNIYACNTNTDFKGISSERPSKNIGYISKSGTSMATPMITGVITRLISDIHPITNRDLKIGLKYSTIDLGYEEAHQGWGLINMKKLYKYFLDNKHIKA